MKSTRSTSSRQIAASPPSKAARAQRALRELHIDGIEALRTGTIDRKPTAVRKCSGASYEVEADGISWARSGARKRTASGVAPSPPASKRTCTRSQQQTPAAKSTFSAGPSKKRKRVDSTVAGDDDFLAEMVRQVKRAKIPSKTTRQAELRTMLPYLERLKRPCRQRTHHQAPVAGQQLGEAAEAYDLDALAAKRFLRGNIRVDAPVLFSSGTTAFLDEESNTRPIEQILDWLPDLEEWFDTYVLDGPEHQGNMPTTSTTVAEIRQRFTNHNGYQQYPWNFPDIPFPAPDMPKILQHPSCNLLNEIVRFIQNISNDDICPPTCSKHGTTAENCSKHFLTSEEVVGFQQEYRQWLGTIMMAEAGALTQPHFDTFGFGTLITCYEGEIGFAWLNATETERMARQDGIKPSDRWRFKIMRPGNTVYMPPGTRHLVFRLLEGKQTLATAVRVLRHCDMIEWLQILNMEAQHVFADGNDQIEFGRVTRGLVIGTKHLLDQAKERKEFEKYGGRERVKVAEKLLGKIEKQLQQL